MGLFPSLGQLTPDLTRATICRRQLHGVYVLRHHRGQGRFSGGEHHGFDQVSGLRDRRQRRRTGLSEVWQADDGSETQSSGKRVLESVRRRIDDPSLRVFHPRGN